MAVLEVLEVVEVAGWGWRGWTGWVGGVGGVGGIGRMRSWWAGGEVAVVGWPRPSAIPPPDSSHSRRSACYKSKRRPSSGLAESNGGQSGRRGE